MIPIQLAPEPLDFDSKVRTPGLRALSEMIGERSAPRSGRRFQKIDDRREDIPASNFPPYWGHALPDLMQLYEEICAYSCFRIHPVTGSSTVDHMAPKVRSWDQVYEWNNYRLACLRMNARKRDFSTVLDPCEIRSGMFELELVGFQVIPGVLVTKSVRKKVERTIDLLGLNDFRRERERDAEYYWARDISLRVLTEESPFVAGELRRQARLNSEDT